MKHHAHQQEEGTAFFRRTGDFSRRHWVAAVVASVMGTLTGTVVPMLEQWHADKQDAEQKRAMWQRLKEEDQELSDYKERLAKLEQKVQDSDEVKPQPERKP
ncbi:MAG: hypothetical protein KGL39_02955 [Patescibacteria group bacterium]|nr:hypothetical protein [Patescibacteria group bacterium]